MQRYEGFLSANLNSSLDLQSSDVREVTCVGYKMLGIFLFIIIVILSAYLSFQVPKTLFIQQFRYPHESKDLTDSKYVILIHINHPITNAQTCRTSLASLP